MPAPGGSRRGRGARTSGATSGATAANGRCAVSWTSSSRTRCGSRRSSAATHRCARSPPSSGGSASTSWAPVPDPTRDEAVAERVDALIPVLVSDVFTVTATDGAARAGVLRTAHGEVPHAGLHAGRHEGDREGASTPDELRALGARDRARQHVPPALPAGRGADRRARRAAPLHGLGRPDPHRLRRLPGLLAARHAARGRRRRRHVPLGLRRPPERFTPELAARDPGAARLRRRDVPRHLPARRRPARRARGGGAPDDAVGGAPARPAARAGPAPLRDHAGRPRPRAAAPLDARSSSSSTSTATRSAGSASARTATPMFDATTDAARAPARRRSRATSWASATPRACSR